MIREDSGQKGAVGMPLRKGGISEKAVTAPGAQRRASVDGEEVFHDASGEWTKLEEWTDGELEKAGTLLRKLMCCKNLAEEEVSEAVKLMGHLSSVTSPQQIVKDVGGTESLGKTVKGLRNHSNQQIMTAAKELTSLWRSVVSQTWNGAAVLESAHAPRHQADVPLQEDEEAEAEDEHEEDKMDDDEHRMEVEEEPDSDSRTTNTAIWNELQKPPFCQGGRLGCAGVCLEGLGYDDAWYDVVLRGIDDGTRMCLVQYENCTEGTTEWMPHKHLRRRSELYMDGDHPKIGGRVLAFQQRDEHDLYFDADVVAERTGADGAREFLVQYVHGEEVASVEWLQTTHLHRVRDGLVPMDLLRTCVLNTEEARDKLVKSLSQLVSARKHQHNGLGSEMEMTKGGGAAAAVRCEGSAMWQSVGGSVPAVKRVGDLMKRTLNTWRTANEAEVGMVKHVLLARFPQLDPTIKIMSDSQVIIDGSGDITHKVFVERSSGLPSVRRCSQVDRAATIRALLDCPRLAKMANEELRKASFVYSRWQVPATLDSINLPPRLKAHHQAPHDSDLPAQPSVQPPKPAEPPSRSKGTSQRSKTKRKGKSSQRESSKTHLQRCADMLPAEEMHDGTPRILTFEPIGGRWWPPALDPLFSIYQPAGKYQPARVFEEKELMQREIKASKLWEEEEPNTCVRGEHEDVGEVKNRASMGKVGKIRLVSDKVRAMARLARAASEGKEGCVKRGPKGGAGVAKQRGKNKAACQGGGEEEERLYKEGKKGRDDAHAQAQAKKKKGADKKGDGDKEEEEEEEEEEEPQQQEEVKEIRRTSLLEGVEIFTLSSDEEQRKSAGVLRQAKMGGLFMVESSEHGNIPLVEWLNLCGCEKRPAVTAAFVVKTGQTIKNFLRPFCKTIRKRQVAGCVSRVDDADGALPDEPRVCAKKALVRMGGEVNKDAKKGVARRLLKLKESLAMSKKGQRSWDDAAAVDARGDIRGKSCVKIEHGVEVQRRCSYEHCSRPEGNGRFYKVREGCNAGRQDWSELEGRDLCHACYDRFKLKGTLDKGRAKEGRDGDSRASRGQGGTPALSAHKRSKMTSISNKGRKEALSALKRHNMMRISNKVRTMLGKASSARTGAAVKGLSEPSVSVESGHDGSMSADCEHSGDVEAGSKRKRPPCDEVGSKGNKKRNLSAVRSERPEGTRSRTMEGTSTAASQHAVIPGPMVVKRGPGRPRKHPQPVHVAQAQGASNAQSEDAEKSQPLGAAKPMAVGLVAQSAHHKSDGAKEPKEPKEPVHSAVAGGARKALGGVAGGARKALGGVAGGARKALGGVSGAASKVPGVVAGDQKRPSKRGRDAADTASNKAKGMARPKGVTSGCGVERDGRKREDASEQVVSDAAQGKKQTRSSDRDQARMHSKVKKIVKKMKVNQGSETKGPGAKSLKVKEPKAKREAWKDEDLMDQDMPVISLANWDAWDDSIDTANGVGEIKIKKSNGVGAIKIKKSNGVGAIKIKKSNGVGAIKIKKSKSLQKQAAARAVSIALSVRSRSQSDRGKRVSAIVSRAK